MTEHTVLTQLGAHARDEQQDDALFERVAGRTAAPDGLAKLERAAAGEPDVALRLEASRPLDGDVVDRIAARALAARRQGTPRASRIASTPGPVSPWTRRVVMAAGPLALAAGMVLYIVGGRGPGRPDLPSYSVTATGEQAMRGPPEASARLRLPRGTKADARFELLLRPAAATAGGVVAYAFAFGEVGSDPAPLDARVDIAPEGSVRITGPSLALDGVREIRVVVGAPTATGDRDDAAARARSNRGDAHVRVLVIPIDRY